MSIRDLVEVMRVEALRRLAEHRKRKRESIRLRMLITRLRSRDGKLEKREGLL